MVHLFGALVRVAEKYNRPDNRADDGPPPVLERPGKIDDHLGHGRQVGAETGKQTFELGNDEYQQHGGDDERHHNDRHRVEQGGFDLALDGLDLFLVGGDLVQDALQNTGLLTGLYQIAVQGIEIKWMLAEGLGQG